MSDAHAPNTTRGRSTSPPVHGEDSGSAGHSGEPHDEAPHHRKLQHHFDDLGQQAEASTLGMWVFLVTEIMFFGGLFLAYLVYRSAYPTGFRKPATT